MSLSLEYRCPFYRDNRYKDYVNIFPEPNFVSPEWRCSKEEVPLYLARQSTDDDDVNDDDDISANVCSLYFMQAPKINPR